MERLTIKEITTAEEYKHVLSIREEVFICEQKVPREIEIDSNEDSAVYFLAEYDNSPVATGRFRKTSNGIKVERVATLKEYRGKGIAKQLMLKIEESIRSKFPTAQIYLNSQLDAKGLYLKLGYAPEGEVFYEANIPHIRMTKE